MKVGSRADRNKWKQGLASFLIHLLGTRISMESSIMTCMLKKNAKYGNMLCTVYSKHILNIRGASFDHVYYYEPFLTYNKDKCPHCIAGLWQVHSRVRVLPLVHVCTEFGRLW